VQLLICYAWTRAAACRLPLTAKRGKRDHLPSPHALAQQGPYPIMHSQQHGIRWKPAMDVHFQHIPLCTAALP
jgi:hypothetical protein